MTTPLPPRKRPTIDGIYELGHVLYTLDPASHGFAREDIATGIRELGVAEDEHLARCIAACATVQ